MKLTEQSGMVECTGFSLQERRCKALSWATIQYPVLPAYDVSKQLKPERTGSHEQTPIRVIWSYYLLLVRIRFGWSRYEPHQNSWVRWIWQNTV